MKEYEQGRSAGSAQTEQAKQQARETARAAKEQAQGLAQQAGQQVREVADQQKEHLAGELGTLAGALRETASNLEREQQDYLARSANATAETIDDIAARIRSGDVADLIRRGQQFARDYPIAFLGGSLGCGFVAGRVLKSSYGSQRQKQLPAERSTFSESPGSGIGPSPGMASTPSFGSTPPTPRGEEGLRPRSYGQPSASPIGPTFGSTPGGGESTTGATYGSSAGVPPEAETYDREDTESGLAETAQPKLTDRRSVSQRSSEQEES